MIDKITITNPVVGTIVKEKINYTKIIINCISVLGCIFTAILCVYAYSKGYFTSTDSLALMLAKVGIAAPIVFILLQIVQVTIPIIPGALGCVAGVMIFGPWYGFIYNYVGICIGSVINFLIAKRYGTPFVKSIVKEKTYNKYIGWLDKGDRFTKLFAIAIFMPVAPDDFLCMLAGLTKMKLKTFTAIILIAKPVSIFCYSLALTFGIQWLIKLIG